MIREPKNKVIFEFKVERPKTIYFRAVKIPNGEHRLEKRSSVGTSYKPFLICKTEEELREAQRLIERRREF